MEVRKQSKWRNEPTEYHQTPSPSIISPKRGNRMKHLAIHGGKPVRTKPFPRWPEVDARDEAAVAEVVRSGNWWMYSYAHGELGDDSHGGSRVEEFERVF